MYSIPTIITTTSSAVTSLSEVDRNISIRNRCTKIIKLNAYLGLTGRETDIEAGRQAGRQTDMRLALYLTYCRRKSNVDQRGKHVLKSHLFMAGDLRRRHFGLGRKALGMDFLYSLAINGRQWLASYTDV